MPPLDSFDENTSEEKKKEAWKMLLKKKKVVKDPVHKDIELTQTDIEIIDTTQFQRLRYIKQLGPAIFVYPSAQHSRFEHSLGTVYTAQRIIDAINRNVNGNTELDSRDIYLIRLVALLHDLVHLPFGHTLEDEGKLFEHKQWADKDRHEIFFYSEISSKISQCIEDAFKNCGIEGKEEAGKILEELLLILVKEEKEEDIKKGEGDIKKLDKPYIADIVGDTICADLLDYIKRDIYFTGINGEFDERIFSYFTIGTKNDEKRIVIKTFKEKKIGEKEDGEIRHDVLSAIIELLRLRYSLMEKVSFHHAKRAAAAMIIKMVECAIKGGLIDKRKLCDLNDASLIHFILEKDFPKEITEDNKKHWQAAKSIAKMLSERNLYKPVYEERIKEGKNKIRIEEVRDRWEMRFSMEEEIEKLLGLEEGDIIIYTPKEDMGAKQAKVLVQLPDNEIYELQEFGETLGLPMGGYKEHSGIVSEELKTLHKKHESLWKLSVFTKEDNLKDKKKKDLIEGICQQWFEGQPAVTVADILMQKNESSSATQLASQAYTVSAIPSLSSLKKTTPISSFCNHVQIIEELVNKEKLNGK